MDRYTKSYSSFSEQKNSPQKGRGLNIVKKQKSTKTLPSRIGGSETLIRQRPIYNTRPKQNKNWRKIFLLSTLFSCVFFWLALMIYLPFFQINDVTINGLKTINYNDIHGFVVQRYLRKGLIPLNNYFLVRTNKIVNDLNSQYAVESVEVKKVFPGILNITVKEKITSIIYDNGSSYSLLDNQGMVIKIISVYQENIDLNATSTVYFQATSTTSTPVLPQKHKPSIKQIANEYYDLPIFYDERHVPIYEKKTDVLPPEIINFLIDWHLLIRSEGIGEVKYFESNNLSAGISVYLNKSWKIYIQPSVSIDKQISNLKILLSSKEVKPNEYIDLRFGERIFWK